VIFGPTFAEMKDPSLLPADLRAKARDARRRPLDPLNLFNISWKADGAVPHTVLPEALTGVAAPIVVLSGRHFPTGSHKVGPGYSILAEKQVAGECAPGEHALVFPSTGNFGIGGAWVGPRMGYRSIIVLPEEMSAERFERIREYGAEVVATPGSESNVKEIYDKVRELRRVPSNRILNQFEEMANYRFHYHCTAAAADEVVRGLGLHARAFVSAMGSAGTIAAGEALRKSHPGMAIVAVEPVQCPTLFNVGFGAHRIEGIGDKHVTWIHNVWATDLLVCVDDQDCLEGLQLIEEGAETLAAEGIDPALARSWSGLFGISGVCNVLASIKAARHYALRSKDAVVTVATDGFDRYPSVLRRLTAERGAMGTDEARRRMSLFRGQKADWILEGSPAVRRRWHNQKYFTWVEQQGKTVDELRALEDPAYWVAEQERAAEVDRRILERRPS
jgi:cysteine synthase A